MDLFGGCIDLYGGKLSVKYSNPVQEPGNKGLFNKQATDLVCLGQQASYD